MTFFRLSISQRIYSILAVSLCCLIGLSSFQLHNLGTSLKAQRQSELKHLTEIALAIVREQHERIAKEGITEEQAKATAAQRIAALRYGSNDYFWINDMAPRMVMHPTNPRLNGTDVAGMKDPTGKALFIAFVDVVKAQGAGFVDYQWPKPGMDAPQPKLSYVAGFAPWGWVIGTGVYIDDLQAQLWSSIRSIAVAAGAALVLLGLITLTIARSMSKAIVAMTASFARLAQGDFEIALPGLSRRDELGDMARAIDQFRVKAADRARIELEREEEKRRAAEEIKRKALQDMADTVEREANEAVREVSLGTGRLTENAAQMSDSAVLLGQNSSSVAAAAEQALANAETVAAASTQLKDSIGAIAAQVQASKQFTMDAVAAATQAQTTIGRLSEAADKVGAVTDLISEIAGQTNLLALNATIEAARAGEAGRGFAVVASEVKSLAGQTAKATTEIAKQIAEIQDITRQSVDSISAIGSTIRNVEEVSATIASAIEEQNAVTREIARTVDETSQAAREVASQIATVSTEAIETGRRASQIRDVSTDIAGKVDTLRTTLIRVIRASTADASRRDAADAATTPAAKQHRARRAG